MNLQSVLSLSALFLFLGFQKVISTPPPGYPSISNGHWDCDVALEYNIDLKKRIKKLEQKDYDFSHISKSVEDLRSIIVQQNIHIANIDNNLKNQIEPIETVRKGERETEEDRNRQFQMIMILKLENDNLKVDLAKQKENLDQAIKDLQLERKTLDDYRAKQNISTNKIEELNSEVSFLKQMLKISETQLSDSNNLAERNSLQLNQTGQNLNQCKEHLRNPGCRGLSSGIHKIQLPGLEPFSALCNGDIEGGGWIVIHKRFDGSVDFARTSTEYRKGLGDLNGEFFIGLEYLHRITNSEIYELYVQLGLFNGTFQFASYDNFRVGDETTDYRLESLGDFRGNAKDVMNYSLNQSFGTYDHRYNDQKGVGVCYEGRGAWWDNACGYISLNGKYINREVPAEGWNCWRLSWNCISLKSVQIFIRPK